MYIIGVSGKTSCNKSAFSKCLVNLFNKTNNKAIYIDIDKIFNKVINQNEDIQKALKKNLSEKIFEKDKISIEKLSNLIFDDETALNLLTNTTLLKIYERIDNLLSAYTQYDYVILDCTLLPKLDLYFNLCNYKIFIESHECYQENDTLNYEKKAFDIVIQNQNSQLEFENMANVIVFHINEVNKNSKIAYYPGSFDPITYGHMDIINKALKIGFDKIIIAISINNSKKTPMFSLDERYNMIKQLYKYNPNVDVILVDKNIASIKVAKKYNCNAMIRGLRNVTDFEYEIDLSKVNSTISNVETIFLTASHKYDFVSSSTTRELAKLGENISFYVPPIIKEAIQKKLN